jgi:hypothetical protein
MFNKYFDRSDKKGVRVGRVILAIVAGIFIAVLLGLALGWLVQFLWNATLAVIFGIPQITYWQAVGLFILAKLFFSLGHHRGQDLHHKKVDNRWHRWIGVANDETVDLPEDTTFFKKYWQEKGREAFEEYVKQENDKKNSEQD